jgi:hypothetical protein
MKILFLDIDGVLNNETTKERIGGEGPYRAMHALDARLVRLLLDWHQKHPEVKLILSSTWRLEADLIHLIIEADIPLDGKTRNGANRRLEIQDYLNRLPNVTHYAIVDDIAQFSAEQQPHFVQTSYAHGLREKDLRKIEAILELTNEDSEPAQRSA